MNIRSINTPLILFTLLLSVIFGCGDGDDDPSWTGTWSLQSVDGQDWKDVLALFGGTAEDKWSFHDDGTWDLEITTTLFDVRDTEKVAGTYTITDTTFSISSPYPEFKSLSDFVKVNLEITDAEVTEVEVTDVEVSGVDVIDVEVTDVEVTVEVTENPEATDSSDGTWIRDGNTLTLTLSDGQVLVFERL